VSGARPIGLPTARRLVASKQRLAGRGSLGASGDRASAADASAIMDVVRALNCLQLDPISVVARSHELVLWSRLGAYDRSTLRRLLEQERRLFEYWAHGASIVLTEDYPIHRRLMRAYRTGGTARSRRVLAWMEQNRSLRRSILLRLRRGGPLPTRALADVSEVGWRSGGWTNERNVDQMLDLLWTQGVIMIAARRGGMKLWDLAERCLPPWTPRDRLGDTQGTKRAAELSLRSLGVATKKHIRDNFTVGRYPGLDRVLASMEREGSVARVRMADADAAPRDGRSAAEDWYVHAEDAPLLDRIERGEWEPRTTLLSPFDNLIRDRVRMQTLFRFDYRMEIYVPKAKRRWGYYVLPILHGDRLVGRIDPRLDRDGTRLVVHAVHAEADAPAAAGPPLRRAIEDLGAFLGASEIEYPEALPAAWERALVGRRERRSRRRTAS
jgi:uncharacterized protein